MSFRLIVRFVAVEALRKLDTDVRRTIGARLEALIEQPRPDGVVRLRSERAYRITIEGYRVLYAIDDAGATVTVLDVRSRDASLRGPL